MKIHFDLRHPAHVHLYRNVIKELSRRNNKCSATIMERGGIMASLLKSYDIPYNELFPTVETLTKKSLTVLRNTFLLAKKLKSDLVIGVSTPYMAWASKICRIPCIAFTDSEPTPLNLFLTVPFCKTIITPEKFNGDFGYIHLRLKSYKELAYLHPNWFEPSPDILDMLDVSKDEKYVILRFSAFSASHDIGIKGFSLDDKRKLVKELEKYARIFISSEKKLPNDLEKYAIKFPPHKMHDALYYASLLIGDTGTMVTEAGILGTAAIINHPKSLEMSNFIELEKKYELIFNIREPRTVIRKAIDLVQRIDIKKEWQKKREKLLKDKIDVTAFMTWFIENYPESFRIMKENPDYQERFK